MTAPRTKAPTPRYEKYANFEQVQEDISTLFRFMQPKNLRVTKTVPATQDLTEGECVLHDDESSVRRVYYKANGVLRYANLT